MIIQPIWNNWAEVCKEHKPKRVFFTHGIMKLEAWQAACQYKQKEIDELKSALVDVYDWYGMFMGNVADKIKKAKVEVEGKK